MKKKKLQDVLLTLIMKDGGLLKSLLELIKVDCLLDKFWFCYFCCLLEKNCSRD